MSRRVARIDDLQIWFYDQQAHFAPLIPPGVESFLQPGSPEILVIHLESKALPASFVKALAETLPIDRYSVPTYDLYIRETLEGAIEIRNERGMLMHAEPAPADYRKPHAALHRRSVDPFAHEPELARYALVAKVTLLPQDYVEHYVFARKKITEAAERFKEDEPEAGAMMRMMGAGEDDLRINGIARATNGLRLELTYTESLSGAAWSAYSLDVPVCSEGDGCAAASNTFMGLASVWTLADGNIVLTGTTITAWLDTRPMGQGGATNSVHRFYAFGANTDADGDGLNDGFERFVTKTDYQNADTDADGMSDGWEYNNGFNPNSSHGADGAAGDPDGDGLSNATEFKLGFDPHTPNSVTTLNAGDFVIERDVISVGISKCGFPDFETGARKFRRVTYGSTWEWRFECSGAIYQDTGESSGSAWYSPLCESYSFSGSMEEESIRSTPDCQFESASHLTWSNAYGGHRVWWVVSQSPTQCWSMESGGTNWTVISGYESCSECTNSSPTAQSISWDEQETYSEGCIERWSGLYFANLSEEYTTDELKGRVETQLAESAWSTNWQGGGAACRDVSEGEGSMALSKMRIRVRIPATTNEAAYRLAWVVIFRPEDTNQPSVVLQAESIYVAGTGGEAIVGDGSWSAKHTGSAEDFYINPPPDEGCVDVVVLKVELKVTHPDNPGPTGSAAKYNNTPNTGSADNLFSTWLSEDFQVDVRIDPASLAASLPAGFITWSAAGFSIPDNTTNYVFTWSSTGTKEITVNFPSCNMTKKIRVDVPDVGTLSQTEAGALVALTSPTAAALIAAYADEAIDYSNNNFPVGPNRDAFRHAYWNALCVSHIGVFGWQSILVSTGHEHDNRDEDHQQAFNSTMDLHNNSVGVTISHTTILGTPDRTPIQNDVNQEYANGGLWIWAGGGAQENSEGILVKSNGAKIYSD